MRFSKYEGLGNDFVVVDVDGPNAFSPEQARAICDRHFGIGADGVLLVSPSAHARARMTVLNADGSRPEMCGNGLRCVALHLAAHGQGAHFDVETDAGVLECSLETRGAQRWIKIGLGKATPLGELSGQHRGQTFTFSRISTGNPHAVCFDGSLSAQEIDVFAPTVSAMLPGGANIEFVKQLAERELDVVVWERGVGRTLACGTGAGAVVVAAAKAGLVPFDAPVTVHLPGGALEIQVQSKDLQIELCGPATWVFSGETGRFESSSAA